jgi:plasmid stabilization system protein ParE
VKLRLRSAAEADVAEAMRWYDERVPGLGARFLDAFDSTLHSIVQRPKLFQLVHRDTRRALFPRPFPYLVLFTIEEDTVSVYAVVHQARDPERWKAP